MSKFYIAFLPINVGVMVFKLFIPNEEVSFPRFGYCYDYLFLIIIHGELYFDVICYWSSLVYTAIGILYRDWFNDFLGADVVSPDEFL